MNKYAPEIASLRMDIYIKQERAHLLEIANRYDSFDRTNQIDMQTYLACLEEFSNYLQSQGLIRDSLMNGYSENDPLHEQFWQLWVHREAEISNEFVQLLSAKLKN